MIYDCKKIYNALIKCNDIGRKLSDKSYYVFINGMMMFHPVPTDSEYFSEHDIGATVAFIYDNILDDLGDIAYIPLFINGKELYSMDKENKKNFKYIEVKDNKVNIVYDLFEASGTEMRIEFTKLALSKGYDNDSILECINSNNVSDLDLWDMFIKFKKEFKATPKKVEKKFSLDILSEDNIILNLFEKYKKESLSFKKDMLLEKDISQDSLVKIFESNKPVVIKFNFDEIGTYRFRLMKSLFRTCTTKNEVSIKVIPIDAKELFQNILLIRHKNFLVCASYRSINY